MENQVSAYVEISSKEHECKKDNIYSKEHECNENETVSSDNASSRFLPCEMVSCFYEYPLKIMNPSYAADSNCLWLYPINFGGGLVEGDNVSITVKINKNCCVLWTSLSFSKVYICENGLDSQQHWNYTIGPQSLLCILPDPLVCYKQASYIQTQNVHMATDANLVLLDWFTSGRYTRGERWEFTKLKSTTSVFLNETLTFKEALNLHSTPFVTVSKSMKSYNIVGTCIIVGPSMMPLSQKILLELGKCSSYGETPRTDLLFAVSALHFGPDFEVCGCIIRFCSESVSAAYRRIEELLCPLFDLLGGNPFKNK